MNEMKMYYRVGYLGCGTGRWVLGGYAAILFSIAETNAA